MKRFIIVIFIIGILAVTVISTSLAQEKCKPGETKNYICPDGTEVPWCTCSEVGEWVCIITPENACIGHGFCWQDSDCPSPQICVNNTCCYGEGQAVLPPYNCCPGLDLVTDCLPGEPCPISLRYCVDCGNNVCDAHENWYNCPEDCGSISLTVSPESPRIGDRVNIKVSWKGPTGNNKFGVSVLDPEGNEVELLGKTIACKVCEVGKVCLDECVVTSYFYPSMSGWYEVEAWKYFEKPDANMTAEKEVFVAGVTPSCDSFCKSHGYEYGKCKKSCSIGERDVGTEYCPQPLKNLTYLHCCCGGEKDYFDVEVSPKLQTTQVNEPVEYKITIKDKHPIVRCEVGEKCIVYYTYILNVHEIIERPSSTEIGVSEEIVPPSPRISFEYPKTVSVYQGSLKTVNLKVTPYIAYSFAFNVKVYLKDDPSVIEADQAYLVATPQTKLKITEAWLDKEEYSSSEPITVYAKVVDPDGTPATPAEGTVVTAELVIVAPSPTGTITTRTVQEGPSPVPYPVLKLKYDPEKEIYSGCCLTAPKVQGNYQVLVKAKKYTSYVQRYIPFKVVGVYRDVAITAFEIPVDVKEGEIFSVSGSVTNYGEMKEEVKTFLEICEITVIPSPPSEEGVVRACMLKFGPTFTMDPKETKSFKIEDGPLNTGIYSVTIRASIEYDSKPENNYETATLTVKKAPLEYEIKLLPGWNMFSLPVTPTSELESDCEQIGKIWHYSPETGRYEEVKDLLNGKVGWGYWIKVREKCKMKVRGNSITVDEFEGLKPGWNQIGSPSQAVNFFSIIGNCNLLSGPWKYDSASKNYVKTHILQPGEGYFVKVESYCKLGSEIPPQPPEGLSIVSKALRIG
ncbi:MAG: COG1470 family protein [Candidatus Baldrarchaeia archaeon]